MSNAKETQNTPSAGQDPYSCGRRTTQRLESRCSLSKINLGHLIPSFTQRASSKLPAQTETPNPLPSGDAVELQGQTTQDTRSSTWAAKKVQQYAFTGAVLGAIGGATARLMIGPFAGGFLAVAGLVATRDHAMMHPLKVNETDGQMLRGLKHTVNATATTLAYAGMFGVGAVAGWIYGGVNGAFIGMQEGAKIGESVVADQRRDSGG